MYGDIENATETARAFHTIWRQHTFTPEKVNLLTGRPVDGQKGYVHDHTNPRYMLYIHIQIISCVLMITCLIFLTTNIIFLCRYPLRPELAESLYYLSRAFPTESEWLYYSSDIIKAIDKFCKVVRTSSDSLRL